MLVGDVGEVGMFRDGGEEAIPHLMADGRWRIDQGSNDRSLCIRLSSRARFPITAAVQLRGGGAQLFKLTQEGMVAESVLLCDRGSGDIVVTFSRSERCCLCSDRLVALESVTFSYHP